MKAPPTYNPLVAHITMGDQIFQVTNAQGDEWDEVATAASMHEYMDLIASLKIQVNLPILNANVSVNLSK